MSLIRIRHNPTRRELNWFGLFWLIFFAAAAGYVGWRFGWGLGAWTILAAAILVPTVGWLQPAVMRTAYLALTYVTLPIGFVVSHVVLAAVYYLVFTPVGLLMKLAGYDPMQRKWDKQAESYWIKREDAPSPDRYFRQY
jgi:hypothetical protein